MVQNCPGVGLLGGSCEFVDGLIISVSMAVILESEKGKRKAMLAKQIEKHEYNQATLACLGLATGFGGVVVGTVGLVQELMYKEHLLCGGAGAMGVIAAANFAFAAYHGEKVKKKTALLADGVAEHLSDKLDGLP